VTGRPAVGWISGVAAGAAVGSAAVAVGGGGSVAVAARVDAAFDGSFADGFPLAYSASTASGAASAMPASTAIRAAISNRTQGTGCPDCRTPERARRRRRRHTSQVPLLA
jgi:hypothetical protein